jgi:hypothetical protein
MLFHTVLFDHENTVWNTAFDVFMRRFCITQDVFVLEPEQPGSVLNRDRA